MADRNFYQSHQSLEINCVTLWANILIGASGAVTSSSGLGIASVVKEPNPGHYIIKLTDSYNKLMWAGITVENTNGGSPTISRVHSSNVSNSANPTVEIQLLDPAAGSNVDATNGDVLLVKIELRNSSVTNT